MNNYYISFTIDILAKMDYIVAKELYEILLLPEINAVFVLSKFLNKKLTIFMLYAPYITFFSLQSNMR